MLEKLVLDGTATDADTLQYVELSQSHARWLATWETARQALADPDISRELRRDDETGETALRFLSTDTAATRALTALTRAGITLTRTDQDQL